MDTTLIGFEHFQWQRGNQSFIFEATGMGGVMSGCGYVYGLGHIWVWLCAWVGPCLGVVIGGRGLSM